MGDYFYNPSYYSTIYRLPKKFKNRQLFLLSSIVRSLSDDLSYNIIVGHWKSSTAKHRLQFSSGICRQNSQCTWHRSAKII